MGKRVFTPEQSSAIDTRSKTLLVSAAAGSGKTATLTERIIQSVLDEKNPESISRMLIVTFTNAAVKELRDRISGALKEKLLENKENERLEREIYMLPTARICTIDSFCNEILKNNAEKFGVSPSYRIADEIEADILSRSILGGLIESVYNGELEDEVCKPEEFEELTAALVGVKADSSLEDELLLLYKRTESLPEGISVYKDFSDYFYSAKELKTEENRYAKYGINKAKSIANHYTGLYSVLKCELDISNPAEGKYFDALSVDEEFFRAVLKAKTYSEIKSVFENHIFASLPQVRGEKSDAVLKCADARASMKEAFGAKCRDRYFTYSEQEWRNHLDELGAAMRTVYLFLKKFDTLFFEEKRRRGLLLHSDIERLAYKSLYTESGEPSELAYSMKEQFSSVYVDEYQDVNALQGKIFEAVATDKNRFMVGDIKQSIYGFRSAKPEIFAKMKGEYPALKDAASSPSASIFMSKNFRCDRGIVEFVNGIFDTVFELAKDSIGYVREDRLEFAKLYDGEEPPIREPEIKLFDKSSSLGISDDEEDFENDAEATKDLPPLWAALKIRELIDKEALNSGKGIEPKDIAIILRKDGGRSREYAAALEKLGISARVPDDKDFFFNAEIELVLCLLNTVDNPERDIYLAGLMCSPLFGFTPDELFFIRQVGKSGSLWESLLIYSESNDFEKGKQFIKRIRHYRTLAEGMPVDALILRLYKETGMLTLAARNGCRENLMLLYDYARKFEASSFEGLYSFINYVNTVIESGAKFSTKKEGGAENSVTITTIHKSKGLEYPIVFIGDAGASLISSRDRKNRVPYAEGFGAAMRMRVKGGLALVDSPVFNAVTDYTADKTKEEELRVYYVALTRARERLYITGVVNSKSLDEYILNAELEKLYKSTYSLERMKTFVDILTVSRTSGIMLDTEEKEANIDPMSRFFDSEVDDPIQKSTEEATADSEEAKNSDEIFRELIERFEYKYPNSEMTRLPEKMSVSRLYPTVLDEADEHTSELFAETSDSEVEQQEIPDGKVQRRGILPRFVVGSDADESARRGIATHLVLQFLRLEGIKKNGADGELSYLFEKGFLSKKDLERVRVNEIELFAKSKLFDEMLSAKRLYREFRFNVMLPASLFSKKDERIAALEGKKILLQGVIDCLIEDENGELHLVDYKTDRISKAEMRDRALAEKKLSDKHSLQLSYYALAVKEIFGRLPATVRVYSLPLGDTVSVKNSL